MMQNLSGTQIRSHNLTTHSQSCLCVLPFCDVITFCFAKVGHKPKPLLGESYCGGQQASQTKARHFLDPVVLRSSRATDSPTALRHQEAHRKNPTVKVLTKSPQLETGHDRLAQA